MILDYNSLKPKVDKASKLLQRIEKSTPKIPNPSGECKILLEGKEFSFPILMGTDGAKFIDLRTLFTKTGHVVFDPGFMATALCCSSITLTDGEKGLLKYRGYAIEDLSEHCSYLEVCYLLLYGELPNSKELEKFDRIVYYFHF